MKVLATIFLASQLVLAQPPISLASGQGIPLQKVGVSMLCTSLQDASKLRNHLMGKYNEAPIIRGLGLSNDSLLEVWVSPDRSTWTVTVTYTSGIICLTASGRDLETLIWFIPEGEASHE